MQRLFSRLKTLLYRRRHEHDLHDELDAHLKMDTQERIESGAAPDEARQAAHRDFGNVTRIAEDTRAAWGWVMLEQFRSDLRYALRNLWKHPGFALITVLTLAIGIGANTAIFSIVNAALLRPLPFPRPDRLITIFSVNPTIADGAPQPNAPADFKEWRDDTKTLERLAAYSGGGESLRFGARPENVAATRVTANFFNVLRVQPMLGRAFEPADDSAPSNKIILSHRLWQSRFGGDPSVVGRSILTSGRPATIVGIMPSEFQFPSSAEIWVPIGCCGEIERRAVRYWNTVGRIRDGQSLESVQAEMAGIAQRQAEQYPKDNRNWSVRTMPLGQSLVRDVRQALWILMGAVAFVIVIACANVGGLTLVQSAARRREVAVRFALGANRSRIVRQLFAEGLIVSAIGVVAGLLFARWGTAALFVLMPQTSFTPLVRYRDSVQLDGTVLLFAVLISGITTIVLTLVPVASSLKAVVANSVRVTLSHTPTRGEHLLYKSLVVGQFACAIVLLAGAGLLIQSFVRMLDVDYGYDPDGLVLMSLPQPFQNRQAYMDEVLQKIKAAPGVESVAVMSYERFGGLNFPFNLEDNPLPAGDVTVRFSSVSSDYFRVLKARLIAGRVFEARDTVDAPGVALINQRLAKEYFPGQDPINRKLVLAYDNRRIVRQIIGVIGDIRQDAPNQPVRPEILVAWPQLPWLSANLVIRAADGDAARVQRFAQEAIWSVNKNMPASRAMTSEEILSSQVSTPRLYMILLGLFAAVAVLLAVLGIYGLLDYIVSRRTNEMAIRVALGAASRNIVGIVIHEGLRLSLIGITLGLAGTLLLTRLMRSLLFEVSPTDPATFTIVALVLLLVALAACYIPARHAAKADPMSVLRHD
jgi:putative ABC transport system permease protein